MWISKNHDVGPLGLAGVVIFGLPWESALAREKGRATPPRLLGSGRVFVIVDRRVEDVMDLSWGERPAGLTMGADLGVDRESLDGVESRGVKLMSRTDRAMREVLRGLGEPLEMSSSSSNERLRLPERLNVLGSMFSASSMKMELLADSVAPG